MVKPVCCIKRTADSKASQGTLTKKGNLKDASAPGQAPAP
jgi:hypothetical protein